MSKIVLEVEQGDVIEIWDGDSNQCTTIQIKDTRGGIDLEIELGYDQSLTLNGAEMPT